MSNELYDLLKTNPTVKRVTKSMSHVQFNDMLKSVIEEHRTGKKIAPTLGITTRPKVIFYVNAVGDGWFTIPKIDDLGVDNYYANLSIKDQLTMIAGVFEDEVSVKELSLDNLIQTLDLLTEEYRWTNIKRF